MTTDALILPPDVMACDREQKIITVCAWCEKDRPANTEWARAHGYEISHGMCPSCYALNLAGDP